MPKENTADNTEILSEPLLETNGYCTNCHSSVVFKPDNALGYYKQCPKCGHAEHLNRRFLRFDRQSRQWL